MSPVLKAVWERTNTTLPPWGVGRQGVLHLSPGPSPLPIACPKHVPLDQHQPKLFGCGEAGCSTHVSRSSFMADCHNTSLLQCPFYRFSFGRSGVLSADNSYSSLDQTSTPS